MTMVIIFAMISVLLPLCLFVECVMCDTPMHSMGAMGSMVTMFTNGPMEMMSHTIQDAISPSALQNLITSLSLALAIAVAFVLFAPQTVTQFQRVLVANPPPPPTDPLGVRLIV